MGRLESGRLLQCLGPPWLEVVRALGIIGVSTLVALLLRPHVAGTNLAMVYLLGVLTISVRSSRNLSVIASLVSVAAFDFFCVPPYLTFRVSDYEYLITFAGMLAVALVISTQTARIVAQAVNAEDSEARTETLYRLSKRLAGQTRVFDVARTAAEFAEEVFPASIVIFFPEEGRIAFNRRSRDELPMPRSEEAVAQWAFEHGERAGIGTDTQPDTTALYIPLKGAKETVGVMGVRLTSGGALSGEQRHLLELFANQAALAIERTCSQHSAEIARVRMQTEEMRSSLLSAVSHDLRTPLAAITGAASTLRAQNERLLPETRQELLDSIADEAERLNRLVGNLIDMTRLQSGIELRRELCPLEEIVGAALHRVERHLAQRQLTTCLPDSLPPVYVDDVLFGQVLVNLLENAIKYTPEGTAIEVTASVTEEAAILDVRDRGPGIPEGEERRIFEKFYRGKSPNVRGAGLGLAICRAIVEAHKGTIEAFNRNGGGAIFRIRLPLPGAQ